MAFYAKTFIYNDVPSELYSMVISSNSGDETTNASPNLNIITQEIFRRPKPYFYGVQQTPVLEFPVSIRTTEVEITAEDAALTQKWLFGQMNYKKLRIVQPDMEDIYFNCFLVDPQIVRVGNMIRGFDAKVICDSPFAYGMTKTATYTTNFASDQTFTIYNSSENLYYTYPTISFTITNAANRRFTIKNTSDNNRIMEFTNLQINETITIDNDLQIVTSSTGLKRISNMSSPINFFRLLSGVNNIVVVSGGITNFTMSYTPLKRMN